MAGTSTVATTPGNTGSKCTEGTTAAATSPVCTGSAGHAADAGQSCGGIFSLNHLLILLLHQEQRDAQLACRPCSRINCWSVMWCICPKSSSHPHYIIRTRGLLNLLSNLQ